MAVLTWDNIYFVTKKIDKDREVHCTTMNGQSINESSNLNVYALSKIYEAKADKIERIKR